MLSRRQITQAQVEVTKPIPPPSPLTSPQRAHPCHVIDPQRVMMSQRLDPYGAGYFLAIRVQRKNHPKVRVDAKLTKRVKRAMVATGRAAIIKV